MKQRAEDRVSDPTD